MEKRRSVGELAPHQLGEILSKALESPGYVSDEKLLEILRRGEEREEAYA